MALLGIDFGTATIKAVKVPPDGRPKPHDVVSVSAIASFADGKVAVGGPVLMMAGIVDDVVVPGLKRIVGRPPDDALVRRACERGGFAARPLGELDLEVHLADEDPKKFGMSLFAACADLLRDACEAATGRRSGHEAVVAVPSWFTSRQRDAFLAIAQQAQLRVRRFVRDTVAGAYWVSSTRDLSGRLAVIDAGAGGVSASVVRISGDRVVHEASFGAAEDGGDDIDAELARTAFEGSDRTSRELVRQACEGLKRELSDNERASREVKISGGKTVEVALERWEMELLVSPLAKRVAGLADRLLAETRLDTARLGGVLALGGSTALDAVQSKIRSHLDAPLDGVDRLKAPALGAALRLAADQKKGRARELQDGEEEVPAPVRSAPQESVDSNVAKPKPRTFVRGQVTTRRKEVSRHRPAVTRRRVRSDDEERPSAAPEPDEDAATSNDGAPATETPTTAPSPGATPPSSSPDQPRGDEDAPGDADPVGDERPDAPATSTHPSESASAGAPESGAPESGAPESGDEASNETRDDADDTDTADDEASAGDDTIDDTDSDGDSDAAARPAIDLGPSSDARAADGAEEADDAPPNDDAKATDGTTAAAETNSEAPHRPASRTKYPARDSQRKYPAVDRSHRRQAAAPRDAATSDETAASTATPEGWDDKATAPSPGAASPEAKPTTDRPLRHPTPVPSSDPATRKRAMAAAMRRHTAIGMSAAPPASGGVIRIKSSAGEGNAGRRMTIPSASVPRGGTITPPGSAVEMMGLAVSRSLLPSDLEPIDPIVLLRRLVGRRSVSGTLEIEQGGTVLEITVQGGRAALDRGEHNAFMKALEKGGGRWKISDVQNDLRGRDLHPLPRLALDLLRKRLRTYTADELEAGLGGRVELAPALRSDKDTLPRKLGMGPRELRFVETMLDGTRSAKSICRFGGLGASTSYQVLSLLELFECLTWREPEDPATAPEGDGADDEATSSTSE